MNENQATLLLDYLTDYLTSDTHKLFNFHRCYYIIASCLTAFTALLIQTRTAILCTQVPLIRQSTVYQFILVANYQLFTAALKEFLIGILSGVVPLAMTFRQFATSFLSFFSVTTCLVQRSQLRRTLRLVTTPVTMKQWWKKKTWTLRLVSNCLLFLFSSCTGISVRVTE